MEQRKVLLITYDFYPDPLPNTYRWVNIAKKWVKQGVKVYVVSANKNLYPSYEEIDGIKIYRTGEFFIGNLKYNSGKNSNTVNELAVKENSKINATQTLKKLFRKIYDITWSKLYWPDFAFLWKYTALPIADKLIIEEKIDKIITVSWMFTAHMIGYKLKTKFNNSFWLAETMDPFSLINKINNSILYHKLNVLAEGKIFRKADLNSVLTERIREEYIAMYPEIKEKIIINSNMFLPENFDFTKNDNDPNVIKLVFLGTLSEDTRSPKNLLILFNNLIKKYPEKEIELFFYGDVTKSLMCFSKYEMLIGKSIFLKGKISKEKVNDILKNSDVLVNIGNNNKYQEPSKVIEYMYSGKKILNVCTINEDTSANLLSKYPLHLNILPDDLNSDSSIKNVFDFLLKKDSVKKELLSEILNDYSLDTIANKYYDCIFGK